MHVWSNLNEPVLPGRLKMLRRPKSEKHDQSRLNLHPTNRSDSALRFSTAQPHTFTLQHIGMLPDYNAFKASGGDPEYKPS